MDVELSLRIKLLFFNSPYFFSLSNIILTYFGKISEGSQAEWILACYMGIWCYAQLKTIGNPRAKNYPNLWHGFNFVPTLDNFKSFQYRHEIWEFYSTLITCSPENVEENLSTYFGLITVFVKEASQITVIKRAQCCVLPWFTCFHVFQNRTSLLAFSHL